MEIFNKIADASLVNLSLITVYIIFPILISWPHVKRNNFHITSRLIVGLSTFTMCIQALAGFCWTIVKPTLPPRIEPLLYFILCLIAVRYVVSIFATSSEKKSRSTALYILMTAILVAAALLRLIDPLRQAALGQSDAYSHLFIINQILLNGNLGGTIYPPGYHWIVALPLMIFPLDPYLMARYGGAFFGLLLVLALYNLVVTDKLKHPAILTLLLAACFPGMYFLVKTSIGIFPNQFGLLLLPVIFFHFFLVTNNISLSYVSLSILLLGLLVSVPMMFLNIVIVGFFYSLSAYFLHAYRISFLNLRILSIFTIIFIISVIYFTLVNRDIVFSSINIISNHQNPLSISHALVILLSDYFSLKRIGFDVPVYNYILIFIGLVIFVSIYVACSLKHHLFVIISVWSLLSYIETALGIFQFSSYQRAGWELLMGFSVLSGYLYWTLFRIWRTPILTLPVLLLLFVFSLASFVFYPRHTPIMSNSENSLIELLRYLRNNNYDNNIKYLSFEKPGDEFQAFFSNDMPDTIITRQFSNFTHGDPVSAILGNYHGYKLIPIGYASSIPRLNQSEQTLVLIDSCDTASIDTKFSSSQLLQKGQHDGFLKSRNTACSVNDRIKQWISNLNDNKWDIKNETIDNLSLFIVEAKHFDK